MGKKLETYGNKNTCVINFSVDCMQYWSIYYKLCFARLIKMKYLSLEKPYTVVHDIFLCSSILCPLPTSLSSLHLRWKFIFSINKFNDCPRSWCSCHRCRSTTIIFEGRKPIIFATCGAIHRCRPSSPPPARPRTPGRRGGPCRWSPPSSGSSRWKYFIFCLLCNRYWLLCAK